MTCGIYQIVLEDGRCNVGQSVDIAIRWTRHRTDLRGHRHSSRYLQRAWDKYGEAAFTFSILEVVDIGELTDGEAKELLRSREQWWMDNTNSCFNAAPAAGSQLGYKQTAEARARIGEAGRGRNPTAEARARMSASGCGRTQSPEHVAKRAAALKSKPHHPPMHSLETRAKMSESQRGRIPSPETCAKISETKRGRTHTEESCANMSAAHIGKPWSPLRRERYEARKATVS